MTQRELEPIYDDTFTRSSRHKQPKRQHYFGWVLVGVFVLALIGFFGWHSHRQSALQNYPVRGVSVSQDDGYIDFHQLQSAKLKFVYLKGTSGASYLDDRFNDGYQRAIGTQMQVGVYQEFSFTSSAEKQYKYFVQQIGANTGNLPIAIHVTYYGKYAQQAPDARTQGKKLAQLIRLLSERYGQNCIVWTTPAIQNKIVTPYVAHAKSWLIMPKLKRSGDRITFMQYTGNEELKVNGQKVDLIQSVFNGTKKEWEDQF